MIIARTFRSTQDVRYEGQTFETSCGFFIEFLQLRVGGFLVLFHDGFGGGLFGDWRRFVVICDESAAGFVGVQGAGEFAVGGVDVGGRGGGRNGEEGVEGGVGTFGEEDFVAEAEDFVVLINICCEYMCCRQALDVVWGISGTSFDHAAAKPTKAAASSRKRMLAECCCCIAADSCSLQSCGNKRCVLYMQVIGF